MKVLLCERVNDLHHSLFHLLNCLIKTASGQVWTRRRARNCLDSHFGQIVCDKDGVVDWCIVLEEMPLTQFEECWFLLMESLPELLLYIDLQPGQTCHSKDGGSAYSIGVGELG